MSDQFCEQDAASTASALPLSRLDQAFARLLQEQQPSDDPRHALLAALTSYQYGRGHACLDLRALAEPGAGALGCDPRALPPALAEAAPSLPWIQGANSPLVLDGERLYLRRNWRAEQSISAAIRVRLAQPCEVPAKLPQLLDTLFPPRKLADGSTDPAPDWQKLACALATRKRLTLITGGPGTGKTTTVVRLLALLQSQAGMNGAPLRIALAAPTGKAAARLSESIALAVEKLPESMRIDIPGNAVTLHRLLNIRPDGLGSPAQALALDLVLVDEASMIDLEMMARLLAAVPVTASLVLLGDKDQLASVEAGAVMGQLCDAAVGGNYAAATLAWMRDITGDDLAAWAGPGSPLAQQTVMLRDSWRFSEHSRIGQWARAVNAGDTGALRRLWHEAPEWDASDAAEVTRLSCAGLHDKRMAAQVRAGWQGWMALLQARQASARTDLQALALLHAFAQFQVLCAVRDGPWGVIAVNRFVSSCLGFGDAPWFAGRPVMVTRNDYSLKLMNGDVGLCLPHASGLRVAFPDGQGGIHWVLPSRLDGVETVFAMTVHKSQGSEFRHVLVILPDQAVAVLTRELLYTAISRAKSRLTLLVPASDVLWRAVERKVLRSGGLAGPS